MLKALLNEDGLSKTKILNRGRLKKWFIESFAIIYKKIIFNLLVLITTHIRQNIWTQFDYLMGVE